MFKELYRSKVSPFSDAPDRFEMSVRSVYEAVLSPGDAAIDVGAHTGKHAIPMAKAVGATGRVYAFEPIAEKYAKLVENTILTPDVRIFTYNACVGEVSGIAQFTYLPTDPGKSALNIRQKFQSDDRMTKLERIVPVLSLDECLERECGVRFVKIDVEGAELAVLKGATDLINKCGPVLHVEVGESPLSAYGVLPIDIYRFFTSVGYAVYDIIGTALRSEDDFQRSIAAGAVYDYFGCRADSQDTTSISNAAARLWW